MLALTRRKGESIIIGDNIEVIILSVQGDLVKIGVDAPRSVPVNRKEIYAQILDQNRRAAERPVSVKDISNLFKIMQQKEAEQKEVEKREQETLDKLEKEQQEREKQAKDKEDKTE